MSRSYDNWERLVAAVLRKEQLWQLFHEDSRSPSPRSEASSSSSSSFRYFDSPLHDFSYKVQPKLVFVSESSPVFYFEDLVRASAKVLGNRKFRTTYKADMDNGITVVVKQLKLLSVSEAEFRRHMELVQNIRHKNVVELSAYFYSKDKKLVLYDHYGNGSVSALLHGRTGKIRANFDWVTRKRIALGAARGCNRGFGRLPLDWKTRPKIALGAARGITHARTINDENLVHGNIRSSNIFHNEHQYGLVSDVGLAKMTSQITFPYLQNAGYCAPEVTDSTKMSQASDVYNFGVVLLELVSGKSPKEIAIVRWITFIIRVKWTAEVIDLELLRYGECEDAMMKLLQIGMKCVGDDPESRPKMVDIVKMLEEIN